MASASALSPPSYALEIRDQYDEKEDFADSKCAFVTVALCPCLVILIIVVMVVSIVLMIDAGKPVEEVFKAVKSVFSSAVKNVLKDGLATLHVPYAYGFANILLTVIVKVATLPLTKKQVNDSIATLIYRKANVDF